VVWCGVLMGIEVKRRRCGGFGIWMKDGRYVDGLGLAWCLFGGVREGCGLCLWWVFMASNIGGARVGVGICVAGNWQLWFWVFGGGGGQSAI